MDESTTLADLLSLNLHNFEDDVRNIVDKAVKEMSMEKVLKELDVTWAQMEFEHDPHPRTKITMLKTSEELIETLEDNQVCFLLDFKILKGYLFVLSEYVVYFSIKFVQNLCKITLIFYDCMIYHKISPVTHFSLLYLCLE